MRALIIVLLITGLMTGVSLAETVNFDKTEVGKLPPNWIGTQTGTGESQWAVVADESAPSKPILVSIVVLLIVGGFLPILGMLVGKDGSIAVTERVIKTLKYEWLRCVPIITGFDHLVSLRTEFESWYNTWRAHMALEGLRPDDLYHDRQPETPKRDAKTVPSNIERHVFTETRLTAYRLKIAA